MTPLDPIAVVHTILAIIRRRFDLLILPALILLPGGFFALKKLPKSYKSSTKIAIQEAKHSNPFLEKFTSPTRLKKRIMLLQSIVTSHKVLGKIVDKEAKEAGKKLTRRERFYQVLQYRRRIKIMYLGQGLVQMEFACRIPKKCLHHLNFVFRQFLKETMRPQQDAVTRSSKFLAHQIGRLKQNLKRTESLLTGYKQKHSLELPETFKINLGTYTYVKKQLTKARVSLSAALQRRDFLYKKLRYLDPVLLRLKEQRTKLLIRLSEAKTRYTDRHPRIRRLQVRLARLERAIAKHTPKRARTLEEIEKSMRWARSAQLLYKDSQTDSIHSNKVTPFERLQETLMRIEVSKKQIIAYEKKAERLKKRLSAYPTRELRLEVLKRETTISRSLYVKLRSLYEESLLRRELELFDASKRVMVIEPAILPIFPTSPKGAIVLGGAFAAALVLSIFLIAVAEISDQSIKSTAEACATFDVEVLGNIGKLPEFEL